MYLKATAKVSIIFAIVLLFSAAINPACSQSKYGPNDTLLVPFVVYEGDSIPYAELDMVYVLGKMSEAQKEAYKKWTRLRNAIYVTYPYAKKASFIFNEINYTISRMHNEKDKKDYIKSREKELKNQFADPLTNLSVYQGKVLMKLINRETHNTCYEIIKEYKGGFSARFWQTVAWVFGSNLKQVYDARGNDSEMEPIVLEVARMYGHI